MHTGGLSAYQGTVGETQRIGYTTVHQPLRQSLHADDRPSKKPGEMVYGRINPLALDRRFSAEIRGVSLGFMRTYKTYLSAKQEQDGHLFLPYDSGICGC